MILLDYICKHSEVMSVGDLSIFNRGDGQMGGKDVSLRINEPSSLRIILDEDKTSTFAMFVFNVF